MSFSSAFRWKAVFSITASFKYSVAFQLHRRAEGPKTSNVSNYFWNFVYFSPIVRCFSKSLHLTTICHRGACPLRSGPLNAETDPSYLMVGSPSPENYYFIHFLHYYFNLYYNNYFYFYFCLNHWREILISFLMPIVLIPRPGLGHSIGHLWFELGQLPSVYLSSCNQ